MSNAETGQVTGTQDEDYDLIWFTEQCMNNALRMENYAQGESRKGAEQGKQMLARRLAG